MCQQHDTVTKSLKSSHLGSDPLRQYTDKTSFELKMWILLKTFKREKNITTVLLRFGNH